MWAVHCFRNSWDWITGKFVMFNVVLVCSWNMSTLSMSHCDFIPFILSIFSFFVDTVFFIVSDSVLLPFDFVVESGRSDSEFMDIVKWHIFRNGFWWNEWGIKCHLLSAVNRMKLDKSSRLHSNYKVHGLTTASPQNRLQNITLKGCWSFTFDSKEHSKVVPFSLTLKFSLKNDTKWRKIAKLPNFK